MAKNVIDDRDIQIIIALADNNMSRNKAANAVYMHRESVVYHIKKVHRLTGLNPMNFYDLHKLVPMMKERLNNG